VGILAKIRRMYFRDKVPLREIARWTGLSRNTLMPVPSPLSAECPGAALLFHLLSKLYERTRVMITTNLALANGRVYLAMPG
jgi:hypothetical protein